MNKHEYLDNWQRPASTLGLHYIEMNYDLYIYYYTYMKTDFQN